MNERMQELAKQAMVERASGFREFDADLFAEEIVRKCSLYLWQNELAWTAFKEDRLFKHFGIQSPTT
jgi:hypothetical protein